jgi:CubicO group peptidase (beta-lactamase class C family)
MRIPTPRMLRPILATAALLLVTAARAEAQWPELTRALDAFASSDSIVGASAMLVRDGRIAAHHRFGFADRAAGQRVDERTIYHWASITKTLTAIAVMQLRDRGRLSLDDPVTRYLPELRQVHDPYGAMDRITIRMLLSHSSGFQNPTWPYGDGRPWEPFEPTRWEQLVAMMPYQQLLFEPGSRYGYSNPAYIYLGRIVEQLTGDPWQAYIQKNIFAPLGMTQSYFGATPYHLAQFRSNNYRVRRDSAGRTAVVANGREFDPGITIPNSGWNAPLTDLALYLGFLTHATRGDSATARRYDAVLSPASLAEMWRPVVELAPGSDSCSAVGLGFFLSHGSEAHGGEADAADAMLVGHTGQQAGFRAFFYLNPRTRTAVIAVLNTVNGSDASGERWAAMDRMAQELVAR